MANAMPNVGRREFLGGIGAVGAEILPKPVFAAVRGNVAIIFEPVDAVTGAGATRWAADRFRVALIAKGVAVTTSRDGAAHIVLVRARSDLGPESVSIVSTSGQTEIESGGARGLSYGLIELAERVESGDDPLRVLASQSSVHQEPATRVRSITRIFCSDVEDKPWYYSRDYWTGYLDLLAANRFNRLHFALGVGYNFPVNVTEDYFNFAYPYLVTVPGYDVQVEPLAPGERQRNLEMLQFASAEAARRGVDFQLGIWTHAYQWTNSPKAHHRVVGLTPANHAAYCRDALATLLKSCPAITGLTLRVHGESGIPDGSYDFWRTVFQAIKDCPRPIELDMHAKGTNDTLITMALETGKPIKLSPKYSAEHQSLGYHQAAIREMEMSREVREKDGSVTIDPTDRNFTRYGYHDLYKQGRRYGILYRRWPGTQRHLMNGDPAQAAAYGRTASFCDADGLDIFEPLAFKGRGGSGQPGGRCGYRNRALDPGPHDYVKFTYPYRLWGHALYAPEAEPISARRYLTQQFGPAAASLERAMAAASRIQMLFTSAHLYCASNRESWFEMFTNIPIVLGSVEPSSTDTPRPWCAATVNPLDSQLFSSISEHAGELLQGRRTPRYSPVEVATWLDSLADTAEKGLAEASAELTGPRSIEFRRWEEDIRIQLGLGRFFAGRFRAATLYEIFTRTGDPEAGRQAIVQYKTARSAWAAMAERARSVYVDDIGYGDLAVSRGHWADRLPAFDRDIQAMTIAVGATGKGLSDPAIRAAIAGAISAAPRWHADCAHVPVTSFTAGAPLAIELTANAPAHSIDLWYRHVNQGEHWRSSPMERVGIHYRAIISGAYTKSLYPLQYYFVLHGEEQLPVLCPGFNETLSNQPYFSVWQRNA